MRWHWLKGIYFTSFANHRCHETGIKSNMCTRINTFHPRRNETLEQFNRAWFILPRYHDHPHVSISRIKPQTKIW